MASAGETCAKAVPDVDRTDAYTGGRTYAGGSSRLDEISPADRLLALKLSIFLIAVPFLGHVFTSLEAPPGKLPTHSHRLVRKKSRCDRLERVFMMR